MATVPALVNGTARPTPQFEGTSQLRVPALVNALVPLKLLMPAVPVSVNVAEAWLMKVPFRNDRLPEVAVCVTVPAFVSVVSRKVAEVPDIVRAPLFNSPAV